MAEEFDINEEYEKIFGVETRETLFSADDEEYNALRQEILDAKREFNPKKSLPFEGIQLLAYDDFKRHEVVRLAEKQGYRIFYIRNTRNSKLVTYGAGYFNPRDSKFYVLKDCFFEESSYFNNLCNKLYGIKKLSFIDSFRKDSGTMTEKRLHVYESASLAASYYRGERTTFREWRDDRGKTLDAYYPKYKASNIDELEEKTFPDYVPPAPPPVISEPTPSNIRRGSITEQVPKQPRRYVNNITEHTPDKPIAEPKSPQPSSNVADVVNSLFPLQGNVSVNKAEYSDKHLFHMIVDGRCKAWGYFETETNYFYICKGSLVSKIEEAEYASTASCKARARFLDKACADYDRSYYVVKKDAKCKSATAAACYALGRTVTYTEWIDDNNKYLKDYYPQRFFMGGNPPVQNTVKEKPEDHLFYLRQDPEPGRFCDAKGWYDPDKQYFILKAGSVISRELAPQYKGTAFENSRSLFVQRNCILRNNKLVVLNDVTLNSPTMAACHVTGRVVKNRTIWTDSKGKTINDIYGMK